MNNGYKFLFFFKLQLYPNAQVTVNVIKRILPVQNYAYLTSAQKNTPKFSVFFV
jgi:hypothetical protein